VQLVASPVIIDARNCLDAHVWRSAGWKLTGLGTAPAPLLAYPQPLLLRDSSRLLAVR
jgi:hypothetical protein